MKLLQAIRISFSLFRFLFSIMYSGLSYKYSQKADCKRRKPIAAFSIGIILILIKKKSCSIEEKKKGYLDSDLNIIQIKFKKKKK